MNSSIHKVMVSLFAGSLVASSALFAGCSDTEKDSPAASETSTGSVGLALKVSDEVTLSSVNYVVTGPNGFKKSGSFDVAKSSVLSGVVGGIPLANGYSIELSATATDGQTSCSGSADFNMTSTGTVSVDVTLQCKLPTRKGSVLVNGKLNVCPQVESLDAAPAEVYVGGEISLVALGSDADQGPSPVSYTWSATSGTLSATTGTNVSLTCTAVGTSTVKLSVSDGDTCPDTRSVTVTCTKAPVGPVTVAFQQGAFPTADYAGADDATIRQVNPTTKYGTAGTCEADGDDGNGVDKSCLLRWDVSAIPAGSKVQSASITVQVTSATSNTYSAFAVTRPWVEADVTWNNATSDVLWQTAGALGANDRGTLPLTTITGATGSRTIELNAAGIAAVQGWVDGSVNGGIVFADSAATDGVDFVSSEGANAAQRPRLSVTYLPGDGTPEEPPTGSGISTDPNLKVAFIGDTDHGTNLKNVLDLIVAEKAQALMIEGDMSYSANPDAWWGAVEAVLGPDFPIFISRGNHDDSSWPGYLPKAANHLGGATRVAGAHDANYKTTWKGLVTVAISKGDKPENITPFLEGDNHLWKICQWHQNQEAMQVGGKGDEMGWGVYEACREQGAIIETGHEHSYERTRTLTSTIQQITDPTCSDANSLCVGPGRTFVNVVGLGGSSVRPQLRCLPATFPYGCNQEWASVYTSDQNGNYGAQFITFNADGDPTKAVGYFKDIAGNVIDNFTVKAAAFQ